MSTVAGGKVLADTSAHTLAFQAGQLFEQLLLNRAVHAARDGGETIVTVERIRSCIDLVLLEHLRRELDERDRRESREAA